MVSVPKRYVPERLTKKDKKLQKQMLLKSRKLYKQNKYFTRKKLKSYKSKKSNHVVNAKKMYNIDKIVANKELAKKTKCSINALKKIVNKGKGAYYSSGSRPNQTAHSWGRGRLASSITGGKASVRDFSILEKGCKKNSTALKLARKAMKTYKRRRVPSIKLK